MDVAILQHPTRSTFVGDLAPSLHERRVAAIALRLFDLLAPLHGLGKRHRKLLRIASLVHDAGRCFGAADHHINGARLVIEDSRSSLSRRERRCVAYLVRYHCGKVPPTSESEYLRRSDGRRKMKLLLGLLRAADGLDSRRISASAIVIKRKRLRLRIECSVSPCEMIKAQKAFMRRRKFKLLERSLNLEISVRVREAREI
jgi:exopolyphosphatase/guanosine-5'-triphosphate,3'-diphosphate pyrophosphatase